MDMVIAIPLAKARALTANRVIRRVNDSILHAVRMGDSSAVVCLTHCDLARAKSAYPDYNIKLHRPVSEDCPDECRHREHFYMIEWGDE